MMAMADANGLISGRGQAASLMLGSVGLLIFGVQPVLLGALVTEGRLVDAVIGPVVTAELLAVAVGSILGERVLRRASAPFVGIVAGLMLAAANLVALGSGSLALLLATRSLVGLSEGALVSITAVSIARSNHPARLSAYFLVVQTLLQLAVAGLLPLQPWAASLADASLTALAASGVVAAAVALLLPWRLCPPARDDQPRGSIRNCVTVLIAAGCYLGGVVVIWSFIGLWLSIHHKTATQEGQFIALALGFQIAGALMAALLSERLNSRWVIFGSAAIQSALVALLLSSGASDLLIYAFAIGYGFLWQFAQPAFTGLLVALDPDRRAVLLLPAAQLIGAALVPLLAAPLVRLGGPNAAMAFGASVFVVSAVLVAKLGARRFRTQRGYF